LPKGTGRAVRESSARKLRNVLYQNSGTVRKLDYSHRSKKVREETATGPNKKQSVLTRCKEAIPFKKKTIFENT